MSAPASDSRRVPPSDRPARGSTWGLSESFFGLLGLVVLTALLTNWLRFLIFDGHLMLVVSYAVAWVPLLAACAYACFARGTRSLVRDFGLGITLVDVLLGLGAGLVARAIASVVELIAYGSTGSVGISFGETVYDGWWVFAAILAPVLFAPFVEELFFRGLLLRSSFIATSKSGSKRSATVVALLVSSVLFAAVHIMNTGDARAAATIGVSTLALGLGAGLIALSTRRIGGAMVAHATFNGSLLLAAYLG
jgi:membrane protease YdiL (CAAX protease family)